MSGGGGEDDFLADAGMDRVNGKAVNTPTWTGPYAQLAVAP